MQDFIGPEASDLEAESTVRLKNKIWNKIRNAHEFEQFNNQEYFRWLEIYKDEKIDLSDLNPISIEQKMAMIEVLNTKITTKSEKINPQRLNKLHVHFKNAKFSKNELANFSADLMILLKRPPLSLFNYYSNHKNKMINESLMKALPEDMLSIGLIGIIDRIPESELLNKLERGKYLAKYFLKNIAKKTIASSAVHIPDELLEKIIIEGLYHHDQELIAYLKEQNMSDQYENFRQVYKPIAFSVGFYFYYDQFMSNKNQIESLMTVIDTDSTQSKIQD